MDGDSPIPLLFLFLFFIVINAFFSCSESAFSCVNKVRLRSLAENGSAKAKKALYITEHFDEALTTALIGINIASIAAASVATVFVVEAYASAKNATTYATLIVTVIMFLFAEMIPKSLANDRSETMALALAGPMKFFMTVLHPLAWVFEKVAAGVKRKFGGEVQPSITEEELIDIIETVGEEGVVDEEQSDLMISAVEFSDTTAADVMTMRTDIVALSLNTNKDAFLSFVKQATHSRIPVYTDTPDHIIGTLQVRWFLKDYVDHPKTPFRQLIRRNLLKPYFIEKTAKIDELLETMRQHKIYLAYVVDENRTLQGLVTIEDFLEELVGEIWDEDDVVDERFYSLGGNYYSVSAELTLAETARRMKRTIKGTSLSRWANTRIGDFVREQLNGDGEEDASFRMEPYEFTVDEINEEHQIMKIIVHILDPDEMPEKEV